MRKAGASPLSPWHHFRMLLRVTFPSAPSSPWAHALGSCFIISFPTWARPGQFWWAAGEQGCQLAATSTPELKVRKVSFPPRLPPSRPFPPPLQHDLVTSKQSPEEEGRMPQGAQGGGSGEKLKQARGKKICKRRKAHLWGGTGFFFWLLLQIEVKRPWRPNLFYLFEYLYSSFLSEEGRRGSQLPKK